MKPPIIASTSSTPVRRRLSPLAIAVVCAGSVFVLLAIAVVGAGLFFRSRVVEARQQRVERVRAKEAQLATFVQGESEPGITYTNIKVPREPWSIHVLKIDRSRKDLAFVSAHAGKRVLGVSMIADQARAVPPEFGRTIGAINGDFYDRDNPTYAGDPRGLQIIDGEMTSGPDTVCVWFDADGNPHLDEVKGHFNVTWPGGQKTPFGLNQRRRSQSAVLYTPTYGPSTRAPGGKEFIFEKEGDGAWLPLQASQSMRARVREVSSTGNTRLTGDIMVLSVSPDLTGKLPEVKAGDIVEISTATTPDLKGAPMAIGGGPTLIKNGKAAFSMKSPPPGTSNEWRERSKYERHPRGAMGWSASHIYLVIVDGRQPGLSAGMKLAELADFFASLGCTDAMNLDGGKSAQMWMSGQIMNSPCQGEDTVANSLLVVRKAQPDDSK
jgi:hypothetical protein